MTLSTLSKALVTGVCVIMAAGIMACAQQANRSQLPDSASHEQFAFDRLRQMSETLASAQHLYFVTSETHEWVDDEGTAKAVTGEEEVYVSRPGALRIAVATRGDLEMDSVLYFSDSLLAFEGHNKKIWSATQTYPSIDEMLDDAGSRFDLAIPVSDFIYSSAYDSFVYQDTRGKWLERVKISGRSYDHLRFEDSELAMELWVSSDDQALPHKLEIIRTSMEGQPKSVIEFKEISFDKVLPDEAYRLSPKPGYMEVQATENKPE